MLAAVCLALLLAGLPALAATPLESWRGQAAAVRILAENDAQRAYEEARRLQEALPADAAPADRARALNLLSRIELYLAQTQLAGEHAAAALALAKQHDDRVGQAEADLTVALNAVNQARIDALVEATTHAMAAVDGLERPDLAGEAMLRAAMMYRRIGRSDDALTLPMQALEIAQRNQDPWALAYAHHGMAVAHNQSGNHEEAREYYLRMRRHAQTAGSKILEADAVLGAGNMDTDLRRYAEGVGFIQEAIGLYRQVGCPFYVAHGLNQLARNLRAQGRLADASPLLDEAAAIYERYGNKIGLWWTLDARGADRQALGDLAGAWSDAERGYGLAQAIGLSLYLGGSAKRLAAVAAARGEHRRAYELSAQALELAAKVDQEKAGEHMLELARRYQTESRQRQIDELTRRNERQAAQLKHRALEQRWLWTLLGSSVLLLASGGFFLLRLRQAHQRLQELNSQVLRGRNKLQATLDAIPDPMFVMGLDGRYYECHAPRSDLLAAPIDQLLGRTVDEVMPAPSAAVFRDTLREAHQHGVSLGRQLSLPLAHGDCWFELSVAAKPAEAGEAPRFIVMSRDITGRKRAEHDLMLRDYALGRVSEAAFLVDKDAGFVYVNEEACRGLGYRADELLGMTVMDIDPHWPAQRWAGAWEALMEQRSLTLETEHRRKDGSLFPIEVSSSYFEFDGQAYSLCLTRDISERKRAETALRESEQRYRLVFENSPVSIWEEDFSAVKTLFDELRQAGVADIEAYFDRHPAAVAQYAERVRVLDVNQAALALHGAADKAALLAGLVDTFTEESFATFRQELVRLWQGKTGLVGDSEVKTLAGESRHVTVHCNVCPGFETSYSKVLVSLVDISERKRAERQLALLGAAVDRVHEAAYFVDGRARFFYVNEEASRQLGYSRETLLGMSVMDIAPGWTEAMVVNAWQGLGVDEAITIEAEHQRKDGSILPVEINITHLQHGGRAFGLAMARDISERKQAERLLHEREQAIRAVVENSPDYIARYDAQLRRIYVNPATQTLFGLPLEQILGKTPEQSRLLPKDFILMLKSVFEGGQELQAELPFRAVNGETGWSDIRMVPEFGPDGGVATVLSIGRDISERKRAEEALAARERQFRTLAENSPDPIFRYDRHCRRIYVNPAVERLAGKPASALLSGTPKDSQILSETEGDKLIGCIRQVLDSGQPAECELECAGTDGIMRYFHNHGVPERGEDGAVEGVLLISRDITQRKRAEQALAERERQFRTLAESLPDNVVRYDRAGRTLYVNPVLEKTLGAQAQAMFGRTIREIHPNGEFDGYARIVDQVLTNGEQGEIEILAPTPDGAAPQVHQIRVVAERNEKGEVVGVLAIGRDITEHKRAEEALTARERAFRSLAENIPDHIIRYDAHGRKIYMNTATARLMGVEPGALLGQTPEDTPVETRAMQIDVFAEKLRRVLASGEPQELEVSLRHAALGMMQIHNVRFVAERDEQDRIVGALMVGRDITAFKQAEQRLQESHAQLRELAAHGEAAREEERKRIAREIHDELGQLLTALRMSVSLVRLQYGPNRHALLEHAQSMMELVDQTIQVVRNVAASLRPAALDMGVGAALEWLADEFAKRSGVPCRLRLGDSDFQLSDERSTAMFRIVQESLTNIARYAQAGEACISLERQGNDYLLEVRDNGIGFDPALPRKQSFGLIGLRERALMLGGELSIASAPGRGTAIKLRIPINDPTPRNP
jgi:PAS domain S-box-containing protein